MSGARSKAAVFAALPPAWSEDLSPGIATAVASGGAKLAVLDDDPTGTQTVHDVPVLTTWDVPTLAAEFRDASPCFYLLTNSRSLPPHDARDLNLAIARNLTEAAGERAFTMVSRSDSALRGHFPLETEALVEVLGPFDATFAFPYFETGGRYTIDDVHYVAEGDQLVPAAEFVRARLGSAPRPLLTSSSPAARARCSSSGRTCRRPRRSLTHCWRRAVSSAWSSPSVT